MKRSEKTAAVEELHTLAGEVGEMVSWMRAAVDIPHEVSEKADATAAALQRAADQVAGRVLADLAKEDMEDATENPNLPSCHQEIALSRGAVLDLKRYHVVDDGSRVWIAEIRLALTGRIVWTSLGWAPRKLTRLAVDWYRLRLGELRKDGRL